MINRELNSSHKIFCSSVATRPALLHRSLATEGYYNYVISSVPENRPAKLLKLAPKTPVPSLNSGLKMQPKWSRVGRGPKATLGSPKLLLVDLGQLWQ